MKILVYQPRVSYFIGGGEIYPLQTAKFFHKLGHDVSILTTRASFIKQSDYFINFINENPKIKIEYLDLDENYRSIYQEPAGINWERWDSESLLNVAGYNELIDFLSIDQCKNQVKEEQL